LTETGGKVYDFNQKMQGKQGINISSLLSPGLYCLLISFSSTVALDFAREIQLILPSTAPNAMGPINKKGGKPHETGERDW